METKAENNAKPSLPQLGKLSTLSLDICQVDCALARGIFAPTETEELGANAGRGFLGKVSSIIADQCPAVRRCSVLRVRGVHIRSHFRSGHLRKETIGSSLTECCVGRCIGSESKQAEQDQAEALK